MQGIAEQNFLPKTIDWKKGRDWIPAGFISNGSQSLRIQRSMLKPRSCLVGLVALWWRRRVETQEQTAWSEDPLYFMGRNSSSFLECIWEKRHSLSGDKRSEMCPWAALFTNTGMGTLADGCKTCCWIFTALYCEIWAIAWSWDCFLGQANTRT